MKCLRQLFLYFTLSFLAFDLHAQSLETIGQLARDGAPQLAIELMDQVQPNSEENVAGWVFFEKQRFAIMQNWQQWQPIIDRFNELPADLPDLFMNWAKLQKIDAQIKLNQTEAARETLRELAWQNKNKQAVDYPLIRRLIIRSYLIDKNFKDVDLAMRRYENDYGNTAWEWQKLRARALLQKGDAKQALQFLEFVNDKLENLQKRKHLDHEALAMRLLALLKTNEKTPLSVLGDVRLLLNDKNKKTKLAVQHKLRYLSVGEQAAKAFGGNLTRVRLIEQALQSTLYTNISDALFALSGTDLWQAYEDYAAFEGNNQQLLIGQDQHWLQEAKKLTKKRPEKARAFYTSVMHKGVDAKKREQAYKAFVALLKAKESGSTLIRHLFASKEYYPDAASIPLFVKYQLVDQAIARQDIDRASELILSLDKAPSKAEHFNWSLRRARVLILGGKIKEGREALQSLFDDEALSVMKTGKNTSNKKTPYAPVDAYLQVVFDLQKVGDHKGAINLFNQILALPLPNEAGKNLRREILFWTADSHKAEQNKERNPILAAAFYLRSATLLDGQGGDPWGQTARFKAAEVLSNEGAVDDARRIYKALLGITKEPARRAMIKYRLQELWLNKKSPSS